MVTYTAQGLVLPVFTPLNDDLTLNYSIVPEYAAFATDNGFKTILVGGSTGEHVSLTLEDRKKYIDEWVKTKKERGFHIQAHVGGASLPNVLNLAEYCAKNGVDSVLTLPELYFKPTTVTELVDYVELVAKAAPNLPILYYHNPGRSKVELNMPEFAAAASARIPNFKGVKFASRDLSEGQQLFRTLKNDQKMYLSIETLLAPAAILGIKSSNCTSFSLFPRLAHDIVDAVDRGDVAKATELQKQYSLAIEALTAEGLWVPVMKAGMEIVTGIKVGPPSLPHKPISPEARQRIHNKLKLLNLAK